jgi:prepilin signal peptidase PulO-like enzyme (type II secretory pathway)
LLGLVVGSFLNAVIYRLKSGESIIFPPSHCVCCGHKLSWKDLIPVFSFVFLRGKCRYCKKPISLQYPLVEVLTGLLFFFTFKYLITRIDLTDFYPYLFYVLFCFSSLIIIFVYDLKHYLIPDKILFPLLGITVLWYCFSSIFLGFYSFGQLVNFVLSGLSFSLFFFLIWFFSKGKWIGFGDVKLALFLGIFLGFPKVFLTLFVASLVGAIIGLGLVFFKNKKMNSELPFGPFLVFGALISFFFSEEIIKWYSNLIL